MPYQIKPSTKLGVWAILFMLFIFLISSLSNKFFGTSYIFSFEFKNKTLKNIISKNLEGKSGKYAIIVEGLSDKEDYSLRSFEIFPSASLYKLYVLAATLKKVEKGELKLDTKISGAKSKLSQRFGEVDYGYEEAPETIEFTVDEALQRIGRISDNFAALLLADKVGWGEVQKVANDLGSLNTKISDPLTTSAADTANFFRKLFKKELISVFVSEKTAQYLLLNQINDRMPAGVPKGTKVVHKTGELARIRHDAGIVYLEGRPYLIVLMSKDLQYEDEATETMIKISRDVYEYFASKK